MKLYFDLEQQEHWHRLEWEQTLGQAQDLSGIRLADSAEQADVVVLTQTVQVDHPIRRVFGPIREGVFVWDQDAHPTGRHPGLYTSLPRHLFNPKRHRTFCYPLTFNEQIEDCPLAEARILYSFMGGISSGLRWRLFRALQDHPLRARGELVRQNGPWNEMFDRTGLPVKKAYAQSLARSRFVLCPRGNSVASVRLFEVMKARRVPVIISDDYVLPEGIDWNACAVQVSERAMGSIPSRLAELEPAWETMANAARLAWERCFGPVNLLPEITRHIEHVRSNGLAGRDGPSLGLAQEVATYRLKAVYRRMQRLGRQ